MSGMPPGDVTVEAVVRALLGGGEVRFGRGAAGFEVGRDPDGLLAVRWCVPRGWDDGARLAYLEAYATTLRATGIQAFVTLSPPEPRVLCLRRAIRPLRGLRAVAPGMERHPSQHDPAVVLAAGRVLDVVAGGLVLVGTLAGVAGQIGVDAAALRVALRELRGAGWVAVSTQPADRLTVRLERRVAGHEEPVRIDRRRHPEDAWAL